MKTALSKAACDKINSALRVLGEPNRLQILCGLGLECRTVSSIIAETGLGQTNVSFHLRILREAGFLRAERRGAYIYYCLSDPELLAILEHLKRWLDARSGAANQKKRARVLS